MDVIDSIDKDYPENVSFILSQSVDNTTKTKKKIQIILFFILLAIKTLDLLEKKGILFIYDINKLETPQKLTTSAWNCCI